MRIVGYSVDFTEKLLVPELQKVSLDLRSWAPQLTSLFLRCSIRILALRDRVPPENDMIQILQASPALVELDLRDCASQIMTKSFLTQFASDGDSITPCLVPMLHTMRVDYDPSNFDILEFADAIQSRMAFNGIKRVEITDLRARLGSGAGSFEPATLSRLQLLRDDEHIIRVLA
jgi:hypothetical protein